MGRKSAGRAKGSGTVYLDGNIYRARWVSGGKVYTRTTGEKDKRAALLKLAEFVRPYQAKTDAARMESAIAQLEGKKAEIRKWEESQPALALKDAWQAFVKSQSRPRCGKRTLESYEQEYFDFCSWMTLNYPDVSELRKVTPHMGKEYAQALLNGTSSEIEAVIRAANIVLKHFRKEHNLNLMPEGKAKAEEYSRARDVLRAFPWMPPGCAESCMEKDEPVEIQKANYFSTMRIRKPARGSTFNRHVNTLALIWRTLAGDIPEKARLDENPFAWDKNTGRGIRRVVLKYSERPHKRQDLSLEEIASLLKVARGELKILIGLGFYTGLRLGDCVLLKWGNIDRVNELIITRSAKTDIETTIRIHPALLRIISEEAVSSTGYLLPELANIYDRGGSGRSEVSRRIIELLKSVGIETSFKTTDGRRARPDKTFHSLRHAYVTQLDRAGVTLRERQVLAGHSTESMTAYYTHQDGAGVLALPDLLIDPIDVSKDLADGGMCTKGNAPLELFKTAFIALPESDRKEAVRWIKEYEGQNEVSNEINLVVQKPIGSESKEDER